MIKKIGFFFLNTIGVTKLCRNQKNNKVTVLNLHRVSNEKDFFFKPITPFHFEALLKYISKHYSVISFADIQALQSSPPKNSKPCLILSFDDGYYDFMEYALPLLVKYDMPCNNNIVNSCANNNDIIWTHRINNIFNQVRERNIDIQFKFEKGEVLSFSGEKKNLLQVYYAVFKRLLNIAYEERIQWVIEKEEELATSVNCIMMNWEQIIECTNYRVEIGSHTYHHDVLSGITDYNYLLREIQQSKLEMEKKIKKPVDILALPNGQSNGEIVKACVEAGISTVLLVDDKVNSLENFNTNKVNLVSRINIIEESPAEIFLRTELFHSKFRKY